MKGKSYFHEEMGVRLRRARQRIDGFRAFWLPTGCTPLDWARGAWAWLLLYGWLDSI